MMRNKKFSLIVLLLMASLVLVACGGSAPTQAPAEEPEAAATEEAPAAETEEVATEEAEAAAPAAETEEAASDESVTLLWGMWGSPEEIATHQKVADAYMAKNPNIKIELWSQPWGDYFTKLQTLWAAGDGAAIPDVMFLAPVPAYAGDGVLEPLDSYIEASGYDLNDYWPGAIDTTSYKGQVYGFPRDVGLEVLYYNKDHFDEANLKYPDETWTWDDLRAAAEALTVKEASGRVSRYGLGMEGGKYPQFLISNGGGRFDDVFNPTECWLSKPESIEAVSFIADLMNDELAMRDANLNQAGGDLAVFQSGQVSMIIQNASRIPAFNAAGLNYDVAPVPTAPGGIRATGAGGGSWTMSASSDNKEAAWQFITFLQSLDGGQAIYVSSGEAFPPLRSVAESDVFLGNDNLPAGRQAFLIQAEGATAQTDGFFPEWNELDGTLISPVINSIWSGEANPAEVLPGLCEGVDKFLAEAGYR